MKLLKKQYLIKRFKVNPLRKTENVKQIRELLNYKNNRLRKQYSYKNLKKGIPLSKEANLLIINTKINDFFNVPKTINNSFFLSKNIYSQQLLLNVSAFYRVYGLKKQYLYLLFDIILSLTQIEKQLTFNEFFSTPNKVNSFGILAKKITFNIILSVKNEEKKINNYVELIGFKYYEYFNFLNYLKVLNYVLNPLIINNLQISRVTPILFVLDKKLLTKKSLTNNINILTVLKRKYFINYFNGNLKN